MLDYEKWVSDAQAIEAIVPVATEAHGRVKYLLDEVASYAIHGYTTDLLTVRLPLLMPQSADRALVVVEAPDSSDIHPDSPLAGMANGSIIEAVVHSPDGMTFLMLPKHSDQNRLGNGAILLHALEHVTEGASDFVVPEGTDKVSRLGMCERRAYATNEAILRAVDHSDFDQYVDSLPFEVSVTPDRDGARQTFDTENIEKSREVAPPSETLTHKIWSEGGISRESVLCTALCRRAVTMVDAVAPEKTNKYIGVLLNTQIQP